MSTPANNSFSPLLQNISTTPPRSLHELPELSLKPILKPWVWLVLAFVALFTLLPLTIIQSDKNTQANRRAMQSTPGVVLGVQTYQLPSDNPSASGSVSIKYSFKTASGEIFYGEQFVPNSSVFATLKSGAPVPISYDPREPAFNGIAGVLGQNAVPTAVFFIFPIFALCFVPLMFGGFIAEPIRNVLKARRVYANGVLAVGRVRFIKRKRSMALNNFQAISFEVLYEFTDQDGQNIEARQSCDNDWLVGKLDAGTEITILYLPEKPTQSIFLEAFIG